MAFTLIDSDTSWQDLAIAAEIKASYNLRRTLLGLSTIADPTADTTVYDFVLAIQTGIEAMAADEWINNSGALADFEGESAYPSKMTLAQAMTAAGLTESGYWRRIADSGTQPATWTDYGAAGWSYGKITDKDLAGPWLFKDIQLALSALTRRMTNYTRWRSKIGSYVGALPFPSTPMSWGGWQTSSTQTPEYRSQKFLRGTAYVAVLEWQVDIPEAVADCEADRLLITIPRDVGSPAYASVTGKTGYANLTAAEISTVFAKVVGNSCGVSTAGGVTTYSGIIAEDASNLVPLCDQILPGGSGTSNCRIIFDDPMLLLDFTFE